MLTRGFRSWKRFATKSLTWRLLVLMWAFESVSTAEPQNRSDHVGSQGRPRAVEIHQRSVGRANKESQGLNLDFMRARPQLYRAKVPQCAFGLKDVIAAN